MPRRARTGEGPAYKSNAAGPDNLKSGNSDVKSENLGAGTGTAEPIPGTKSGPKYSRPEPAADTGPEPTTANPTSASGGYTDAIGSLGTGSDNFTFAGSDNNAEPTKRGRGRPRGSTNRVQKGPPLDISGIEKLLLGIHTSLSRLIPEAELSPDEAHDLASAYSDVAQYYPILRLPDKWAATINFGTQLALVYGSRFAAWRIRMLSETPKRAAPAPPQSQTQEVLRNVFETQPQKSNGKPPPPPPAEIRTGEIPGVGNIEFPTDHELLRGRKIN